MSDWAYQARLWQPLRIDSKWRASRRRSHDADLRDARMWFVLPRQLASAVEEADVAIELLSTVSLVILDEYDSFSKAILYDEPHASLSFKEDMIALRNALQHHQRSYLFMSATPPKSGGTSRRGDNLNIQTIWEKHYAPKFVQIPRTMYWSYIPVARVIPFGVEDPIVYTRDRWIKTEIGKRLTIVRDEVLAKTGQFIDFPYLIHRMDAILRFKKIALPNKVRVSLSDESLRACQEFKTLKHYRLRVFEDLSDDESEDEYEVVPFSEIPDHLSFSAASKLDALGKLLKSELQSGHSVVVFIRFIKTIIGLAAELQVMGIESGYVFGDQDPLVRESTLREFRSGSIRVLLASRELFGRGFDLPEADTAIFYSPKDNVRTTWQEFLRIRSTHATKQKRVFVLFYLWTAESSKMQRLLYAMWQHGANNLSEDDIPQYDWEFSEEIRPEGIEPDGFSYFDFAADEGAAFWEGTEDKQQQQSFYEFGDNRAGHEVGQGPPSEAVDKSGAAKKFCVALAKAVGMAKLARVPDPLPYLSKLAKASNMIRLYTNEAVSLLLRRLRDAITSDEWMSASNLKSQKRILLMKVHPDHNRNISSEAQFLYNTITAWLIQLL
jgi:hypothetical protein